jgi:hypothetical protein
MVTDEVWLHALYLGSGYFPNLFNGVFLGHRRFFGVPALSQPTSSRGKRIPFGLRPHSISTDESLETVSLSLVQIMGYGHNLVLYL